MTDATGLPGAGPGLILSLAQPLYPLITLSALVGEPVSNNVLTSIISESLGVIIKGGLLAS